MRLLSSHQCGLGSNPGGDASCRWSLSLVLSLLEEVFSSGTLVFPSPQKLVFPNPIRPGIVDEQPLCGFFISKSLFISFNFFVYFPLPTIHFAWPHLPPSPPPVLKFCIYNRYFQFPLGIMVIPREIEVACAKFWWLMSYIMGKGKW